MTFIEIATVAASLITIICFITGKQKIRDYFFLKNRSQDKQYSSADGKFNNSEKLNIAKELNINANLAFPEEWKLDYDGDEITVSWKSGTIAEGIYTLGFAIFWNTLVWGMVISNPGFFLPFALLHLGVGVYVFASALNSLFTYKIIRLNKDDLLVYEKPIPLSLKVHVDVEKIKQFYVVENKRTSNDEGSKHSWFVYDLNILNHEGRKKTVVSSMKNSHDAQLLEKIFESKLGIVDEPVVGEIDKRT